MEYLEVAAEMEISHLHGYNGVTEKIRKAMYESAKQFVYIGFLLKEVKDYKYYEEGGYESVYDYAEYELGFKKSSTKNFIAIAETFGIQEWRYQGITRKSQSMSLQTEYERFNYSQLVELLAMTPTQRKTAKPEMTVKDLRKMKQKNKEEAIQSTPPPACIQQTDGQTSDQVEILNAKDQKGILGHEVSQKGNTISPGIIISLCKGAKMTYDPSKRYRIFIMEKP